MTTSLTSTDTRAYGAVSLSAKATPGLTVSASAQTRDVEDGYVKSDAATGSVGISYKL